MERGFYAHANFMGPSINKNQAKLMFSFFSYALGQSPVISSTLQWGKRPSPFPSPALAFNVGPVLTWHCKELMEAFGPNQDSKDGFSLLQRALAFSQVLYNLCRQCPILRSLKFTQIPRLILCGGTEFYLLNYIFIITFVCSQHSNPAVPKSVIVMLKSIYRCLCMGM